MQIRSGPVRRSFQPPSAEEQASCDQPEIALQRIGEARIRIDRAARRWSPTILREFRNAVTRFSIHWGNWRELEPLLHQTVDSTLGAGVCCFSFTAAAKIGAGLLALKNETAGLERLVDSAAAFLRARSC